MDIKNKLSNTNALVAFLILECIAITAFAIGGVNNVFYIIGAIVGLITVFVTYNRFSRNEAKSLLLFMGAMVVVSLFSSFGNLYRNAYGAQNVIVVLAVNFFLFMGIGARRLKGFKTETILITIGAALGLLTLISMIYSWTQYGFFYAVRYKETPIYYYNAELFNIAKEGYWLQGFAFKETALTSSGIFGILCSCYLAGLAFFSPKKEKIAFYSCLAIGVIGFVYLLTIPNITALIFLLPAIIATLLYKFLGHKEGLGKAVFWVFVVGASLALLFFILLLINAKGNNGFASLVANNKILNRLFNSNRIVTNVNVVLRSVMNNVAYFFGGVENLLSNEEVIRTNTKMFEIEILKEGGMIALIVLLGFIVFSFFSLRKYMKNSDDSRGSKIIILVLLLSFFIYESFECNNFPLTHETTYYTPILRSPLMLTMLFVLGYAYYPLFIKDGESFGKEPVDDKEKEKAVILDEDYEFKDEEEAK